MCTGKGTHEFARHRELGLAQKVGNVDALARVDALGPCNPLPGLLQDGQPPVGALRRRRSHQVLQRCHPFVALLFAVADQVQRHERGAVDDGKGHVLLLNPRKLSEPGAPTPANKGLRVSWRVGGRDTRAPIVPGSALPATDFLNVLDVDRGLGRTLAGRRPRHNAPLHVQAEHAQMRLLVRVVAVLWAHRLGR